MQRCIVERDKWSKLIHATMVTVKGNADPEAAKGLKYFIANTGYNKSEIQDRWSLRWWMLRKLRNKFPPRHAPPSNGSAERDVSDVKEQLKMQKNGFLKIKANKLPN